MNRMVTLPAGAALFLLAASVFPDGARAAPADAAPEDVETVPGGDMVRDIVRGCLAKWSFSPPAVVELTLEIDASGKVTAVEPENHVSTAAMACIREEIAAIFFEPSTESRKVRAVVAVADAHGASWQAKQEKAKEKPLRLKDPGAGRMTFVQTAFQPGKGSLEFRFTDGSIFSLTYGITDNVSITLNSVTPLGFWGLGVYPKVSFRLAPGVRLGFVANVGFLWIFMEGLAGAFLYGGAPVILTLGSEDYQVTLSLHLEGLTDASRWKEGGTWHDDIESYFFIVPDIGASFKVARYVKLHVELWSMLSTKGDWKKHGFNGRIWGIASGCRFFWEKFYIDLSAVVMVLPFFPEMAHEEDGAEYIEELFAGAGPMISFGFTP
jgi:hypothetical protein